MKRTIYIITTLLLLAGCGKEPNIESGSIDPTQVAPVELNTIRVDQGAIDRGSPTRAGETIVSLAVGQQFRLYAFAKGVVDINKMITTRTYTIKDSDGTPVMDDLQEQLYLPIGDVDIYLVGPLSADTNVGQVDEHGVALQPNIVDVATDHGVFAHHGVDLIASKTELKVVAKADNKFTPSPLRHKMAKVEIVVQRPTDATYQNLTVTTVQIKNQSLVGEYKFGDNGGVITPADEGNAIILPSVIEDEAGEIYRTSSLMIPRKDVYMKVGVFFICNVSETEQVSRRMESGTLKYPLVAGQNNRFVTKPNISTDLLFRYRLLPWDEITMPEDGVHPNEDLLFSYSGADAPVQRNGKRYWIDRSGNGRDAELVGNVKYNATEKYYYTTDANSFIRVPALGDVPVYTLELMATSEFASATTPVLFYPSSTETLEEESLSINFPREVSNNIGFYAKRGIDTEFVTNIYPADKGYLENIATWAFAKNATTMSIRRNGVGVGTPLNITGKPTHGSFNNNNLLKWFVNSNVWTSRSVKLYGARMSSSYLTDNVLKQNHRNDMMVVKQLDVNQGGGYVRDGLILDLQGDVAPQTIEGKKVWADKSGMGNHAEIFNAPHDQGGYVTYTNTYLKLIKSLGTNQSFTVEMLISTIGHGGPMCCFSSVDNQANYREFSMRYNGYSDTNGSFSVETPFLNNRGSNNSLGQQLSDFPYVVNNQSKLQLSITRTENVSNGINLRSFGISVGNNPVATTTPLNEMKHCYFGCYAHKAGWWYGKLLAIRFYNRVLTDAERQLNYQLDKEKYNLLK